MARKNRALRGDVLLGAEKRNTWGVTAPHHHTLEDVLDPGYLWNVHDKMREGDIIEIGQEHHEWFVRLYVAKIDRETQGILTRTLERHEWADRPIQLADLSEAFVVYKGPAIRYCVQLGKDYLVTSLQTREAADTWLEERRSGRRNASGTLMPDGDLVEAAA